LNSFLSGTTDSATPPDIKEYFLAGEDQQKTNQPHDQTGG